MKKISKLFVIATGMLLPGLQVVHANPQGDCIGDNPVIIHTMDGGDQIPATADSLQVVLIGNIKTAPGASGKKMVKACSGTVMDYDATSEASESVTCRMNGTAVPSKGRLKVSHSQQRLMCTDKPTGNDVDVIRIMASN